MNRAWRSEQSCLRWCQVPRTSGPLPHGLIPFAWIKRRKRQICEIIKAWYISRYESERNPTTRRPSRSAPRRPELGERRHLVDRVRCKANRVDHLVQRWPVEIDRVATVLYPGHGLAAIISMAETLASADAYTPRGQILDKRTDTPRRTGTSRTQAPNRHEREASAA